MSSVNDKLDRVRKPRVHIKYEVETENGMVQKELPFVVGVMGDYSGNNSGAEFKPLRDRKFITIDRDNFNEVMSRISPGSTFRVKNTLKGDDSEMAIDLKFDAIDDFEPTQVVEQVPALKKLLETRNQLRDLLTKSDRSHELESLLEAALQDPKKLQTLSDELSKTKKEADDE
jgi:type VI secretion system protein ImpB